MYFNKQTVACIFWHWHWFCNALWIMQNKTNTSVLEAWNVEGYPVRSSGLWGLEQTNLAIVPATLPLSYALKPKNTNSLKLNTFNNHCLSMVWFLFLLILKFAECANWWPHFLYPLIDSVMYMVVISMFVHSHIP